MFLEYQFASTDRSFEKILKGIYTCVLHVNAYTGVFWIIFIQNTYIDRFLQEQMDSFHRFGFKTLRSFVILTDDSYKITKLWLIARPKMVVDELMRSVVLEFIQCSQHR